TTKGKKVSRNGIEQSKLSQYIGSLTAVLFAPEDLSLVNGSPSIRRRFLDMAIGQVSPTYVHDLSQLQQLLAQRNSLLKQLSQRQQDPKLFFLDVLDEKLIQLSTALWKRRFRFLRSLRQWAKEIHS